MTATSRLVAGIVSVVALGLGTSIAATKESPGPVTHVTLYRGQALVTRTIAVDGPTGSTEIVVGNLPEHVVPGSLFAEGNAAAEVRAVRFRTRAVGQEPREEVRKLDEAIEQVNEKLQLNGKKQQLLAKQTSYLDQLEGFVAPTAKAELSKGVLDADALQKVTLFSFEQRAAVADKQVALEKEAKELGKQLSLLQRKRAELTRGASQTVREAVLFVEKRGEEKTSVRLNYLVENCGWSPAYTLRAAADRKQVQVECNGLIHQMTGEDWNGVELVLSTASPALSAAGPGLAPLSVSLTKEGEAKQLSANELSSKLEYIRQRQGEALVKNRTAASLQDSIGSSWAVNVAANEFQTLELVSGKDLVTTQQMVRILRTSLKSRFYHVATPVLTGYVYREAELVNTSEQDLLAGPTSVYLNGRFVGRGEIPTVARGQMLVAGFGADPQLRARRELVDKTETVQGGNRELGFQYRLILENYKDQPMLVRVFDRLPHCERAADIRITLGEMKDPLDDDVLYLRRERPKGILRWEIEVPAGAIREEARLVEYGFKLEFDRNFRLATTGGEQQQKREFEELQRRRFSPSAAFGE